jgi:hypothetical protein
MFLLLACSLLEEKTGPPGGTAGRVATVETTRASCAQYDDLPEVLGVCLAQRIVSLSTVADVNALCPQAGEWESTCRQAWVDEQQRLRKSFAPDELLAACGPNDDCAFQILDTWPAADVLDQIARCEAHARTYESDCVGHALHRWTMGRPTPEEGLRVRAARAQHAQQLAAFFGMSEACGGTLTCPEGTDLAARDCRLAAESYRKYPGRCPER